jgi:cytidylate kinase
MPQATPVIAVDGPAAAGKGTLSKSLAKALGFDHLDTGLLYRAVGKKLLDAGQDPSDPEAALQAAKLLTAQDLQGPGLRGEAMGRAASICSSVAEVRAELLDYQRRFASAPPGGRGAVLDGRDIGTAVCPEADLKIWMTASPEARASRRAAEDPHGLSFDQALAAIRERDEREINRAASPMRPADDALTIDTTSMSSSEALGVAMEWAERFVGAEPAKASRPRM